jgi:hypothetical protein
MQKRKIIAGTTHCILALFIGLLAVPLQAYQKTETQKREGTQSESATRSDSGKAAATKDSSPSKKDAGKAAASTDGDLASLKEQILSQQKQIEVLMASLEAQKLALEKELKARDTSAGTGSSTLTTVTTQADQQKLADLDLIKSELEALAESSAQANQRLTKIETDTAAYNKANDAKIKQIGNFNFSGDVRARLEPFFQEGAVTRHRDRFRVRLNMTGKVSDEISGGISLATGSLDDPISTNQTFTGFFNRKNFAIDKAWITYKPSYAPFLKLDAGKFAYPWYRTELTFDNDLNPEGFAQTLSFNVKSPVFKNLTLVGFQLPFNEVSGGFDSFIYGGQIQTQFQLGPKARLAFYGSGVNVKGANPIAVALGSSLNPSLANSNTLKLDSTGKVVGYAVKFAYVDAIMKLDLNTTSARYPVTLQFDFVNNTRGSRERSGYWADFILGKLSNPKDVQFGYSFIRIEKDAVIGAWNGSDLRMSTNVRNHRLQAGYQIKSNLTAQFTAWIGKLANPLSNVSLVPSGVRAACTGANTLSCVDPYLKRLQFDILYKF